MFSYLSGIYIQDETFRRLCSDHNICHNSINMRPRYRQSGTRRCIPNDRICHKETFQQIPSKERNVRVFQKSGDFSTAVKVFKSLGPADIEKISYPRGFKVVFGYVGDRFVHVSYNGRGGKPELTILKQEQNPVETTAEIIIYTP